MEKLLEAKHIIGRQNIEINFENIEDGFAIQNRVKELFYEKLLPQMELLFDEVAGNGHYMSFDKLDIDCGKLSREHWEDEWVEQTLRNIRMQLLAASRTRKAITTGREEKLQQSFFYFLRKGHMPWNGLSVTILELEELQPTNLLLGELKLLIQSEQGAAGRLVNSFSSVFVNKWIEALMQEKNESIKNFLSSLPNNFSRLEERQVMVALLESIAAGEKLKTIDQYKKDILSKILNKPKSKKDKDADKQEPEAVTEGIYIQNAGLVLLHPFLLELFTTLGLAENKVWKTPTSSYTAMIVLEYLLTGTDEYAEFNMPLNKVFCGLDMDEVLPVMEPIPETFKKECNDLLVAVIQHWKVLKHTGIDALRETFLQRNGKLTAVDNGWRLTVEQKVVDVLLNQLPWGIGTIQLPWMNEMIHTEWC